MEINEIKYGFKLASIKELTDLDAKLYEYTHIKSGATVVYIQNEDTNCCFAAGFRTLPTDSTGVCHIIEHSVLCGSEKYPLKELFVNLMKTSMTTFLNAFTANDWTMYPFASQTPKDFDNVLSIYCDSVFRPISMVDPKPFLQEGWHLELVDKDSLPSYKGVVYNEMKGAMSSVDRVLGQATLEAMFKDSPYGVNSGGEPDDIPNLTYEGYKAFYRKHYTPQNAMTYFYGKMDIESKLKFLDEEYFSKYEKSDEEIIIEPQKPFINRDFEKDYELGKGEELKDNTYMSLCYSLGDYDNYKEFIAMQVLCDALFSKNDSPIKRIMLDAKLGEDVNVYIDDDKIKPTLNIELTKTNKNKKEEFFQVFTKAVKDLVEQGIDKDLLTASINNFEFKDKELDTGGFPKGLVLAMNMMGSFNYRTPLESHLEFTKHYASLREGLKGRYFEELLEKYILNSNHYVQVICNPSLTLGDEKKKLMDEKMKALKENMSEEEIDALVKQTQELIAFQNRVDTKKELDSLPKLSLRDIPSSINWLDTKKMKVKGIPSFYHELSTNKIAYLRMYFDQSVIPFEDLPYVKLLLNVLTNLPTSKYSVSALSNQIKTYLGDFNFSSLLLAKSRNEASLQVKVTVSALDSNVGYIADLLNEVLLHTKFRTDEVKQTLSQMVTDSKMGIMQNGTGCAITKVNASTSIGGTLLSKTSGVDGYRFFSDLLKNFKGKEVCAKLREISKLLFTKKNCTMSLSGDTETIAKLKDALSKLKLPSKPVEKKLEVKLEEKSAKATFIPAGVSYNAVGCSLEDVGASFDGRYLVLSHIVNYDYLWKEVRVKGGAYGTGMRTTRTNDIFFSSYRDPNVSNTYKVFEGIADYLRSFKVSKDEFRSYIIGAAGAFDAPLSNAAFINSMDYSYLSGVTKKDLMNCKKQLLHTTMEDIVGFADTIEAAVKNGAKYTIGNETKVNEANLFEDIKSL